MKQLTIRPVSEADAAALLKIYSPYVENTAVSFEYSTPSETEFRERIRKISRDYPYLAVEADGQIAGYAYASPFKGREAYRHCAEVSISLYRELERYLLAQNVFTVYACIAVPDETDEYLTGDSERFHAKMGYRTVGRYDRCSYKFGRWHNMIWMEKEIGEKPAKPEDFIPFSCLPAGSDRH